MVRPGRAGDAPLERKVGDVMTAGVVTMTVGSDHAEAARLMRQAGVKRIPIVGRSRRVGIVGRPDIMRAFARPDSEIIAEILGHMIGDVLWIDPRLVEVGCVDGNVALTGRLETRSDATFLETLTRRVDGVVSVASNLNWVIDNTELQLSPLPHSSAAQIGLHD